MLNKGLLLACALALISACDTSSTDTPAPAQKPAASVPAETPAPKREDPAVLAKRYADRELSVLDVSEVQLDGAATLSISFSAPLDAEQDFAAKVHLVDTVKGKLDGAWELSDNQMELRLRHLEPQRKLVLTVDKGLLAVNGKRLEAESVSRLETRDMQPTVGFASRGSLLPTRLAEGLPVIALNVDKVDVEFFRIKPDMLSSFLVNWGRNSSLYYYQSKETLDMAELVYSGRFDLNPA
ncbi:alpha-2-macroglobulin family protein, partial [Pseudomonas putida]|nr:alpha-2-macroglobulin family protein [Pseudomonas putida]